MRGLAPKLALAIPFTTLILLGLASGQVAPTNSLVSAPATVASASEPETTTDTPDIAMDPASLLPDLPTLPKAKATLVGGTVAKMDRVRDQLTVQVLGGGKMKVAFDTRTQIFHDGTEAAASDLHTG